MAEIGLQKNQNHADRSSHTKLKGLPGNIRAIRPGRILSIDTFRGITVLAMLMVNNKAQGGAYPRHLSHAAWGEGVHFADMVFPWFIFLAGAAIPFSSRGADDLSAIKRFTSIFRRSAALVLLGCLISSSYAHRPLFDFGVLQLIGFSYFIAAYAARLPGARRAALAATLLLAHWAALRFFPVPDAGAGLFEQEQNFAKFLNDNFLSSVGLEGALSILTTSALAIMGTFIGEAVRGAKSSAVATGLRIAATGLAITAVGVLWGFDLPMNKRLWTASYVVFSAGLGTLAIGVLYLLIDGADVRKWTFPFVVFGSNALLAFIAPILVNIHFLREWTITSANGNAANLQQFMHAFFVHSFGRAAGGWLFLAAYIGFWWLIMWGLYRKRIFFKV